MEKTLDIIDKGWLISVVRFTRLVHSGVFQTVRFHNRKLLIWSGKMEFLLLTSNHQKPQTQNASYWEYIGHSGNNRSENYAENILEGILGKSRHFGTFVWRWYGRWKPDVCGLSNPDFDPFEIGLFGYPFPTKHGRTRVFFLQQIGKFWYTKAASKYGSQLRRTSLGAMCSCWIWGVEPPFHPLVNRQFFLLKSLYFGGVHFETQPNTIKYICWLIFFYSTKYPRLSPLNIHDIQVTRLRFRWQVLHNESHARLELSWSDLSLWPLDGENHD